MALLREKSCFVIAGFLPPRVGRAAATLVLHGQVAAEGVAQEHQAHHRQEVLVAGVVGVGAQGVGRLPEALLDGFDVFELEHVYDASILSRAPGLVCRLMLQRSSFISAGMRPPPLAAARDPARSR